VVVAKVAASVEVLPVEMENWVKAGVLAQIACVGFSIWGVYRGEHPLATNQDASTSQGASSEVNFMNPAWYGPIASGSILAITVGLFIIGTRRRVSVAPPLAEVDNSPVANATRKTFESLSISQRLLVRHIYHNPNTATAFLLPVLSDMGFPAKVAGDSLNKVLTTNLVSRDSINTFPNADVKAIVSQLIERDNLPTVDTVNNIASETIAAVQFTAKLGCDKVVDELKQNHSGEINALNAKLAEETSAKSFHEGAYQHLREQHEREVAELAQKIKLKQTEIEKAQTQHRDDIEKARAASVCRVLADEAEQLLTKLSGINANARVPGQEDKEAIMALRKPLAEIPWPWHSRALVEFQYAYSTHRLRAIHFQKKSSGVTRYAIPNDAIDCEQAMAELGKHKAELMAQVDAAENL
jgi:hypothetical protein